MNLRCPRSMIKYDVEGRYAVVHKEPAVDVMALAAAALFEAW